MAPCEWVIDIIQEWVQAQGYTTEAWVAEWFTPLSVTGHLTPNATCLYFKAGTYKNQPYYKRSDGTWFIWWDGVFSWVISQTLGVLPPVSWFRVDTNVEGPYLEGGGASGTPTVALGHRSLCTSFINRGDPPADDFSKADFITDGTWREKDLSAIVPAGATAVLVRLSINDNLIDQRAKFARHGDVNHKATSDMITQVGNIYNTLPVVISIDTDRKIDYWFSNTVWTAIYFTVIGWWL